MYVIMILTKMDGTRNFGYGMCHWSYGSYNSGNVQRYNELGIDITQPQYMEIGTGLDVEIVTKAMKMEATDVRTTIEEYMNNAGISLEEHQIHALMALGYQWGEDKIAKLFIAAYNECGGITEDIRYKMVTAKGNRPFLTGNSASSTWEVSRAAANWTLFYEGKYTASNGEVLDPNNYYGGGEFLEVATNVWIEICTSGKFTKYGGSNIPCTGPNVDCSAYASWVIYEYGYTEFAGWQKDTNAFYTTNWNQKYGWEEIPVGSGENPYDILQPGDLFVRWESGGTHHITLIVEKRDGLIYCYDCGSLKNWKGNTGVPIDRTYFLTKSGPGKIIRVTPP